MDAGEPNLFDGLVVGSRRLVPQTNRKLLSTFVDGYRVVATGDVVVKRGRASRVRVPAGRLCLLRQIRDELVAGLEQFLLVDDVVAVEDGTALVARSGAWRPARGRWRGSGWRAAVRRQS